MDRRTLLAAAGAAAVLPHGIVRAQAFPSRPISIYVAFPAGGPTDQFFRAIAESASKILGQSVIVENKPGGGGTLAPIAAKNAKPDGYVVSQMPLGVFRVPHMQKSPQFDPIKDFTYIINLTGYTFGLAVPANAPWKTIKDFVEDAKRNPGQDRLRLDRHRDHAAHRDGGVRAEGRHQADARAVQGQRRPDGVDPRRPHPVRQRLHRLGAARRVRQAAAAGDVRAEAHQALARRADADRTRVRHGVRVALRARRPGGHGPAVVRTLHDAFKKALEEPKITALLDRFDQPMVYMSAEDYTKFARQTYEAEKVTVERLGLKGTM